MANSTLEASQIFQKLSDFYEAKRLYCQSGGTPPDPFVSLNGMNYGELLTLCQSTVDEGINFATGAAQEAIAEALSVFRELDIGTLGKSGCYLNFISEASNESEWFTSTGAFLSGVVSGNITSGSQS